MSMPNIPDINPLITLSREEVVYLLLSSIALEEISMSHIMNAEGEKLQRMLQMEHLTFHEMLLANKSVERMLRSVIKNQMLLQFKLEDVIDLIEHEEHCHEE
ncbi:hypothetical protein B5M42_008090 [Paenibacillus athensensis]|uniref:Uncharacterized protein n=1 Tax=Paenibacillus athensensis TaxID=1967502 RepID=A0A4Y8PRH0_9BACL|nr:hypothetical protein [Paenibacillus athensensis]MCD1258795.1 hypothetical protein [Paenibacillus athensensis]